ncbi:MAG TPA: glycosyltransferase [Caulobacteraceae bacterium]
MRILNVADFNWMTGRERDVTGLRLFDLCRKITMAATRADHLVVEFSDRSVARTGAPLRLRALGAGAASRRFLQVVDEFQPQLILLHFADAITNDALGEARRLSPGVAIADINIDPIDFARNKRRLARRKGAVDGLFVTTAEPALAANVGATAFAAYLPNPVDPAVETGRGFETDRPQFHLVLPVFGEAPRSIGAQSMTPTRAARMLIREVPDLRLSTPGADGQPAASGYGYFMALRSARAGWSLSKVANRPLYASDRMAHFFGWGLLVVMERAAGFERFYGPDEAVFYDDFEGLAHAARRIAADDSWARAVAENGWRKTWTLFNSGRVLHYLLAQLFDEGGAAGYEWPCERWGAK